MDLIYGGEESRSFWEGYKTTPRLSTEKVDVLNYWKFNGDGSPICSLAMDLMAIPATSASLEGMFSVVAEMDDSDRQRLTIDHKCQLQCIRAWKRGPLKKITFYFGYIFLYIFCVETFIFNRVLIDISIFTY